MSFPEEKFSAVFIENTEMLELSKESRQRSKTPIITNALAIAFNQPLMKMVQFETDKEKELEMSKAIIQAPVILSKVLGFDVSFEDIFTFDISEIDIKLLTIEIVNLLESVGKQELNTQQQTFLIAKCSVAPMIPIMIDKKIGRKHYSFNLLAIAWAEIWYFMEMKIERIKICPYCGEIFIAPKNNPNKSNCGSPVCKKEYIIESHGGQDGYRQWLKELKRKQKIGGNVGRPKKQKEGV